MPKDFPDVPSDIFTSESESGGNSTEESLDDAISDYSNNLITEELDKSKKMINFDSSQCNSPGEKKLVNSLSSPTGENLTYLRDFEPDLETTTRNVCDSVFSSPSGSPIKSPAPFQLSYSTPLVNMHTKPTSLHRNFHNLSLRIFSEDCDEEECLRLSPLSLEIDKESGKSENKPVSTVNCGNSIDNASDDSESFEALMARIRGCPPAPVRKSEPVHGDSSFVVSDSFSSEGESSENLNFYRRFENQNLQRSITKVTKIRRRVRVKSSSSEGTTEQKGEEEAIEITKADTSKHEESDYRSELDEMPPPTLLPPHRAERPQQSKAATSDRLKEMGNKRQGDDIYSTLPFIYSLDSIEEPSFSNKSYRRRHPSAERFVKDFKKNREELANRLYLFYNDIVFDNKLPKDLRVQWNERLLKTAGQCIYMRRKVKNPDGTFTMNNEVKIELSGKVCTSAERVRDTLLHEACHAAVWMVHGVNDTHGRLWRAFVQRANSTFPDLPPVTVRHTYAIEARYTYRCTGCFTTINRHSKSLDIQRKVCGLCKSRFQLFINKNGKMIPVETSQFSTQPSVQMLPRSKPVFAEFVKDHYKEIRGGVSSHKDAMTQLGRLFRSLRVDPDKENQSSG